MKSRIITLLVFILSPLMVLSQNMIKGSLQDNSSKSLNGANVLLVNSKDSSLIKGTITNASGQFTLDKVPAGKYRVAGSMVGYQKAYSPPFEISGSSEELKLAPIILLKETKQLRQVIVTARKPLFEQKIDRMVVNVQNSITSAGGTALEVLEKSPGILVDRQNNTISMSGKDGVVVMINGKINHMPLSSLVQLLAGMNASSIEKIELITNPPSNFDAEGNAGFINIVLKSNPNFGTNGSYTFTAGYGKGFTPSGNVNLNHRNGKINLFGNYSFSYTPLPQVFNFYRKINKESITTENFVYSNRDAQQRNHNARVGIDFQPDTNTVIGALFSSYDNRWSMDAVNDNRIMTNSFTDTAINIVNDEINRWRHFMGNFNLQRNLRMNQKITFDLDYLYYHDNNPVNYVNSYFNGSGSFLYDEQTKSGKITPIRVWVAKSDYTRKLGKKISMESGVKASISRFTNDVNIIRLQGNVWTVDNSLSAEYLLKEHVAAAYTSATYEMNAKTNVKFGLRYEHTTSNLSTATQKDIIDRKYGNLFPSLYISRKLNDKQSVNLSYNKRISRPTFNDMAPFVIFMDPNTFFSGNPALQPAIAHSVKADYLLKGYILSVSYNHEDGAISRFQPKVNTETNRQTFSAENLDNVKTINATITLPFEISRHWNMQNTAIATWQELNGRYDGESLQLKQKNFHINSSQNFTLPKNYSLELSGFYRSPGLFGLYKVKPFGTVNFGIQKKFENKSTLRFNVTDIFNTMRFRLSVNAPEYNLITRFEGRFVPRTYRITYTRSFGNKELSERRNRTTGSEEERGRVQE